MYPLNIVFKSKNINSLPKDVRFSLFLRKNSSNLKENLVQNYSEISTRKLHFHH